MSTIYTKFGNGTVNKIHSDGLLIQVQNLPRWAKILITKNKLAIDDAVRHGFVIEQHDFKKEFDHVIELTKI